MRHKFATLAVAAFVAGAASFVWACPDHEKKAATVAQETKSSCGAKAVKTLAKDSKSSCGGNVEAKVAQEAKPSCGAKTPTTVAQETKSSCGSDKAVTTVAQEAKSSCGAKAEGGSCCGAKTEGKSCCGAKAATTVAGEPKSSCGAKAATTVAQETKSSCGGKTHGTSACGAAKADGKPSCGAKSTITTGDSRVDAALASLPKIRYRVGEQVMCCEQTAAKLAESTGKPLEYLIGDEVLNGHCAAEIRMAAILEGEIQKLAAVQYAVADESVSCPATAKRLAEKKKAAVAYRVAGIDFESPDKADKAVKLVSEAVDGVKMSYKVGDEKFCCDKMAGMRAKGNGGKMSFVVGDEETTCENHARLLLMEAKARAAVQAAATAS